jgi:hypothetical protein
MIRPYHTLLVLGTALAGLGWALPAAHAESITYDNDTEVAYYNGGSPQEQSGDVYWDTTPSNGGIGGEPVFFTPSVTVGMTSNSKTGDSTVTISFSTGLYSGSTNVGGTNVYAADIFIGSASSTPNNNYTYAIALGFDSADGGYSLAAGTGGLYKLPTTNTSNSYDTSSDIWGSRTKYTYGGAYAKIGSCAANANPTTCSAANVSPTVLKSNGGSSAVNDTSVTVSGSDTSSGAADGTLTITITGLTSTIDSIFDDFDLFWGTGDCSNAPIWEDVNLSTAVPEPSTLALLASALALAAALVRRRRRAALLA